MRHLSRIVVLASVVGSAAPAGAQDLNYQTFLIGDRALGMGGAFTGLADDASAAWYNPAGLAQLPSSSLSGSLSVNAFTEYVVEDGYASNGQSDDLEHDSTPSIPLFVGLVRKFGPRDAERVKRHAFALSTIHPTRINRSFRAGIFNGTTTVSTTLTMNQDDAVSWWGPSYAFRVSSAFALGVSGYLVTRDFRHEEDEVIVTTGMRDPDGVFRNSTVNVRQSVVELEARSAVFRLGVSYDPAPGFRLGLMVQPPGIQFSGSSTIFDRRVDANLLGMSPSATFFLSDQGDLDAESPIPWEVRLGASYRKDDTFAIVLDGSLYGPLGSETDPIQALGDPQPEAPTGETPQEGTFAVRQYHSELTANASLGFETVIADVVPLRAGAFTNLSAAPSIDGPSDVYGPADVDAFGASLSVGMRTGGYDLAVGAAAVFGSGTGYRLNPNPGLDPTPELYLPADVRSRNVYFFLSGHQRAVMLAAREVYDEYIRPEEERRRREQRAREQELLEELRAECEERLREELERATTPEVAPAAEPPTEDSPEGERTPDSGEGEGTRAGDGAATPDE